MGDLFLDCWPIGDLIVLFDERIVYVDGDRPVIGWFKRFDDIEIIDKMCDWFAS